MEYRVLVLDETSTRYISVPLLRKLRDLVRSGATLIGLKPIQTPSLADSEDEFFALVAELWPNTSSEHVVGKGQVLPTKSLDTALHSLQIAPDVELLTGPDAEVRFVHRTLGNDGEVYFICNGNPHSVSLAVSFRVTGRQPELWRADTATITPLTYRMESGRTIIPLRLESHDSVFIVFGQTTSTASVSIPEPVLEALTTLEAPWDLTFPSNLGAPPSARFDRLHSWTEHSDPGIKYFSGVATYSRTLPINSTWLEDSSRLQLDLGEVKYLAEVFLNGKSVGVVWKSPFTIDVTDAARPGDNHLEIKVANLWPNRLIGDKQSGAEKIAFATYDPFKADDPLLPSGLLGPVTLVRWKTTT